MYEEILSNGTKAPSFNLSRNAVDMQGGWSWLRWQRATAAMRRGSSRLALLMPGSRADNAAARE